MAYISSKRSELTVHTIPDNFGDVLKTARQNKSITIEALAEKIGVTERYLYRLENEGKKPAYDVLFKLIRELSINPDFIFYPEKEQKCDEIDGLIRMLYQCDQRSLSIVTATLAAALNSQKN